MTTYSAADLATRVLKDLGLVEADETPSASDLAWATETVSSEVALMSAKGIVIWNGSDQSVPLEYLTVLSRRIGLAVGPSFGLMDLAQAQMAMTLAERDLRVLAAKPPTGAIAETDYF